MATLWCTRCAEPSQRDPAVAAWSGTRDDTLDLRALKRHVQLTERVSVETAGTITECEDADVVPSSLAIPAELPDLLLGVVGVEVDADEIRIAGAAIHLSSDDRAEVVVRRMDDRWFRQWSIGIRIVGGWRIVDIAFAEPPAEVDAASDRRRRYADLLQVTLTNVADIDVVGLA